MLWFVGRLTPTASFSEPIDGVHRLFGEWKRRQPFLHPRSNLIGGGGAASRGVHFQQWKVNFKLHQFGPVARRHLPLNVGLDLPSIVTTGGQAFVQNRRLASEEHDAVNFQQMGQVAVDKPTPFCRRLPSFGQSVNVNRSGPVRFVDGSHAIVFLGEGSQR